MNWAHVGLLLTMAIAVTIDIMKPTALAFVMPGMTVSMARIPSQSGRCDTGGVGRVYQGSWAVVMASFLWGWLGDIFGRQASTLYAGIGFLGHYLRCHAELRFGI